MKKAFLSLLLCFFSTCFSSIEKPALIVYLGPEGCPWSERILNLFDDARAQDLKENFSIRISPFTKDKETYVKEGIDGRVLPLILLIDDDGAEIARVEAELLNDESPLNAFFLDILNCYRQLKIEMTDEKSAKNNYQELYTRAQESLLKKLAQELLEKGLQEKDNLFFAFEKYAQLLVKFSRKHHHVKAFKKELLSHDLKNKKRVAMQLALLEFEALKKRAKIIKTPNDIVKPLTKYIKEYRGRDNEGVWRMEMTVAQFFQSKGYETLAQKFFERAKNDLPSE